MKKIPRIARMGPYIIDEKAGKKAFCTCGVSTKNPYCDGSHKGTDFFPEIIILEKNRKVAWCGCKRTCNSPYCDGTHSRLE